MKETLMFRLSKNPYANMNTIHVFARYEKGKGYVVGAEFLELYENGLCGKCFCKEYYEHNGDGVIKIFPANRRSAKKEAEAGNYAAENALSIAELYLKNVRAKISIPEDTYIITD